MRLRCISLSQLLAAVTYDELYPNLNLAGNFASSVVIGESSPICSWYPTHFASQPFTDLCFAWCSVTLCEARVAGLLVWAALKLRYATIIIRSSQCANPSYACRTYATISRKIITCTTVQKSMASTVGPERRPKNNNGMPPLSAH